MLLPIAAGLAFAFFGAKFLKRSGIFDDVSKEGALKASRQSTKQKTEEAEKDSSVPAQDTVKSVVPSSNKDDTPVGVNNGVISSESTAKKMEPTPGPSGPALTGWSLCRSCCPC